MSHPAPSVHLQRSRPPRRHYSVISVDIDRGDSWKTSTPFPCTFTCLSYWIYSHFSAMIVLCARALSQRSVPLNVRTRFVSPCAHIVKFLSSRKAVSDFRGTTRARHAHRQQRGADVVTGVQAQPGPPSCKSINIWYVVLLQSLWLSFPLSGIQCAAPQVQVPVVPPTNPHRRRHQQWLTV